MGGFVVLEGLDGAGTTTQASRLAAWLRARGEAVAETHEPTDGPVGRLIRATLRRAPGAPEAVALPWLFAADRADHLARVVEPALAAGAWVVSDRYYHSSLAYQSLDLPLAEVHALNARFRVPELTVFLAAPVDVCLARVTARGGVREIFEERAALQRVSAAYEEVLAWLGQRGEPIARVDAAAAIEDVTAAVTAAVAGLG